MCGRFSVQDEIYEIKIAVSAQFEQLFQPWQPKYNISPSASPGHEPLIVVADADGQRSLRVARWWFIPPNWDKPLNRLPTTFNARAEQMGATALWRQAYSRHRCLVPANGWREFKTLAGKKQPFYFHLNHKLFAFAGLLSRWQSPDVGLIESFAIVTTAANESVAEVHDRMPLIVPVASYGNWLSSGDDSLAMLAELQLQNRTLSVERYPCNPVANDVRYEGPMAIQPVVSEESRQWPIQQNLFGPEFMNSGMQRARKKKS